MAQILEIIDCYAALANGGRSYRSAMGQYEALQFIKKDVIEGKFNKSVFKKLT